MGNEVIYQTKCQACLKNVDFSLNMTGPCELNCLLDMVLVLQISDAVDVPPYLVTKETRGFGDGY